MRVNTDNGRPLTLQILVIVEVRDKDIAGPQHAVIGNAARHEGNAIGIDVAIRRDCGDHRRGERQNRT